MDVDMQWNDAYAMRKRFGPWLWAYLATGGIGMYLLANDLYPRLMWTLLVIFFVPLPAFFFFNAAWSWKHGADVSINELKKTLPDFLNDQEIKRIRFDNKLEAIRSIIVGLFLLVMYIALAVSEVVARLT